MTKLARTGLPSVTAEYTRRLSKYSYGKQRTWQLNNLISVWGGTIAGVDKRQVCGCGGGGEKLYLFEKKFDFLDFFNFFLTVLSRELQEKLKSNEFWVLLGVINL